MEHKAVLIIGASRGHGHAMAAEFVKRGWKVVGTISGARRTSLHSLAAEYPGQIDIEQIDVMQPDQLTAFRRRLSGRCFDILFYNAGTANQKQGQTIADVSTSAFMRVMITNALSPMRAIEALQNLVAANGMIGVMSSGQGSISSNEKGGHEVYRGSKAALNMYMRSYAARHAADARALVLMAPGWIRIDLGGPDATFSIEESIPKIVDVLLAQRGKAGLQFLDREGHTVPW